jgi:hypothetical protein
VKSLRFFANSKEVLRTPFPLLPPLAPALLLCRRLSAPLTAAPAPPRRHLLLGQAPRVALPFPGPAFLPRWLFPRAPRLPERHPAATSSPPCPVLMPAPLPFLFYSVAPADGTKPISFPFCCRAHPEPRTPPPPLSSTPATSYLPWAAHPRPPRTITTPWEASPHLTDAPKPLLVAGLPPEPPRRRSLLAGKLLSPLNPYLRPFSAQSDHLNSFPFSCCSY